MSVDFNKEIGKLRAGFRETTLNDLIQLSDQKIKGGKAWTAIQLRFLVSGKGSAKQSSINSLSGLNTLLKEHPEILVKHPNLTSLLKTNVKAGDIIAHQATTADTKVELYLAEAAKSLAENPQLLTSIMDNLGKLKSSRYYHEKMDKNEAEDALLANDLPNGTALLRHSHAKGARAADYILSVKQEGKIIHFSNDRPADFFNRLQFYIDEGRMLLPEEKKSETQHEVASITQNNNYKIQRRADAVERVGFQNLIPAAESRTITDGKQEESQELQEAETSPQAIGVNALRPIAAEKLAARWNNLTARSHNAIVIAFNAAKDQPFFQAVFQRFKHVPCLSNNVVGEGEICIHANRIDYKTTTSGISKNFIAAQAPFREDIDYPIFWKAIFKDCNVIVDLTTPADRSDKEFGVPKALSSWVAEYGPLNVGLPVTYEGLSVTLTNVQNNVYTYKLQYGDLEKTVTRIHFDKWTDHGAIKVENLRILVDQLESYKDNRPLIHCRAGIGRTGTLITAAILKASINDGDFDAIDVDEDYVLSEKISTIIEKLRMQRGEGFVQELSQFELLHDYAIQLLNERRQQ